MLKNDYDRLANETILLLTVRESGRGRGSSSRTGMQLQFSVAMAWRIAGSSTVSWYDRGCVDEYTA